MADESSFASYNKSGFAKASGVADLQTQASNIKTDQASLRAEAEAQYRPTFEREQQSVQNQLSSLIKAQTDDSDLMNTTYQQSINTMMSKLTKRGLNVGATPQATVDALGKFHNEVMTQRQAAYDTQRQAVQNVSDTLQNNYELNIQARVYDNINHALDTLNDLLAQIAKLQSSSYNDYINYIQAKSSGGGGGGGRRRRYGGGSSSSASASATASTGLSPNYFSGTNVNAAVAKTRASTANRSLGGGGTRYATTK